MGQDHDRRALPVVPGALPDRGQVLQSQERLGERQRGERGRVPAPQPHGPVVERRVLCAVKQASAVAV